MLEELLVLELVDELLVELLVEELVEELVELLVELLVDELELYLSLLLLESNELLDDELYSSTNPKPISHQVPSIPLPTHDITRLSAKVESSGQLN